MTETPQADALLTALISGDPRIEAFADLTDEHEREKALHVLLALLTDPSDVLCVRAVQALDTLGDTRAVQPLIHLLSSLDDEFDGELFNATFNALVKFGDPQAIVPLLAHPVTAAAWPDRILSFDKEALLHILSDAAQHPDDQIRTSVFAILGHIDDSRSIDLLIRALNDVYATIRIITASALMNMHVVSAIPFLRPHLSDPYPMMRQWTAAALGQLGDRQAVPALRSLLEDENQIVRMYAAFALTSLGEAEGTTLTRALIASGNLNYGFLGDGVEALRAADEPVMPLLLTLAKYLLTIPAPAIGELMMIAEICADLGDPAALPVLEQMLEIESTHDRLQQAAQQAIQHITGNRARRDNE